MDKDNRSLIEVTSDIVAAYVSNNSVAVIDLSGLLKLVHAALATLVSATTVETVPTLTPAIPIKKSITPDYIICLEDGKKYKSLRRHLSTTYNLTPDEYRAKWGLPDDYPMVAANYSARRSNMAKEMGLGATRSALRSRSMQPTSRK